MGKTILEMIDIKKSFSGIYALSGINFSLEMGEVHALLGENGAGKSTIIKVLGGIYKPDSGTIKINGQEAEINGVSDAQEKGIGIIHQEIVLVPYLTVAQNLFLGREIKTKFGTVDMRETNRRAGEMLANLGVNIHPDTLVESLTIAQQQMVEIVKAVSFDGRIIVMDEPTSSLSNDEVEQLFGIIERLKAKQVSIIYISHRMEELFRIFPRIHIRHEKCLLQAVPKQFIHSPQGKIQNRSKLPLGHIRILIETPADQSIAIHIKPPELLNSFIFLLYIHVFRHHYRWIRVKIGSSCCVFKK